MDPPFRENNVHLHSNALVRERIALQIRAVVVPYRIELDLELSDPEVRKDFRGRARDLLDHLDGAVGPYPDLQEALALARAELGLDLAKPL